MQIKPYRDLNIELLRIVLMILIIFYHFIVHGRDLSSLGSNNYQFNDHTLTDGLLVSFLLMPVNCFVFISGYYGIKFRIRTVFSLLLQTSTYSILIFLGFDLWHHQLSLHSLFQGLFPISRGLWWYPTVYFFLYLISPLLNAALKTMNKFQFFCMLGVLSLITYGVGFVFNPQGLGVASGYSLISFITIYFYGFAFRNYFKTEGKTTFYFTVYLISSLAIYGLFYISLLYWKESAAWRFFTYSNPLVLIAAISFFFLFRSFTVKAPILLRLTPAVFGVYLIHEHAVVRQFLIDALAEISAGLPDYKIYLLITCGAILVYIVCSAIEIFRQWITEPFLNFLMSKIQRLKIDEKLNTQ